jgi:hypothetical protein
MGELPRDPGLSFLGHFGPRIGSQITAPSDGMIALKRIQTHPTLCSQECPTGNWQLTLTTPSFPSQLLDQFAGSRPGDLGYFDCQSKSGGRFRTCDDRLHASATTFDERL